MTPILSGHLERLKQVALRNLLCVAVLLFGVTVAPDADARRDDIVVRIDTTTAFVFLEVDGFSADMGVLRGTVSIETNDPNCIASPDHPCQYIVNHVRIEYSPFVQPTNVGTFLVDEPFIVVQGPVPVEDIGLGIVIPVEQAVEGGSELDAPGGTVPDGFRRGLSSMTQPMTMNLDVVNQAFSLEGEFTSTFEGSTGSGILISSGEAQFTNVPPVAEAGQDITVSCGEELVLDASGTTDLIGTLDLFRWTLADGSPLVTINAAAGTTVAAQLDQQGTHLITLEAYDSFGGRGTDTIMVTVKDPTPEFTFVPGPITTTACGALNIGQAQATTSCGMATVTNDAPAFFPVGVTEVTWTATSGSGATQTAVQRVEVVLGDDPSCCPAGSNVIEGTSSNDNLVGTAGDDCILGKGGQDTIMGGAGNDLISGGDGDDVIDSGAGNDVVHGGSGQDQLAGGSGNDVVSGGDGDDVCEGGMGNDRIEGGQGQDQLAGNDGDDTLFGNDGDDTLDGSAGDDHLAGGGLHDTCLGGSATNSFTSCESLPDAQGAPDACMDGDSNGTETDVDCGGISCPACGAGKMCDHSGDCEANVCTVDGVCQDLAGEGSSALQAALRVTTDWGAGFCIAMDVTNPTPAAVSGWAVVLDTNESTIYTSWNGDFSALSGELSSMPSFEWNQEIDPGATDSSIGFCAVRDVPGSGLLPFVVETSGG